MLKALLVLAATGGPLNPCQVTVGDITFVADIAPRYCTSDNLSKLFPSGSVVQVVSTSTPSINAVYKVEDLAACVIDKDADGNVVRVRCRDVLDQPHEMSQAQLALIRAGGPHVSLP